MKNIIKTHLNLLIVVVLAVVFFLGTASFNYLTQELNYVKWTSPDETANYFFSKRLSQGETIAYFDQAAIVGNNMVMPRSVRNDAGWLKPVSFLGIILIYGSIGSVFGVSVIPFLTPFFAALGVIIFFLTVRRVFSERVALVSAFLLASFPVYIYYSIRSMFHNVLFIVLLMFGIYLFMLATGNKKSDDEKDVEVIDVKWTKNFLDIKIGWANWFKIIIAFLAGLFIGLAAITRSSEIIWLAPSIFIAWLFYARRLGIIKLILMICGFFLAVIPNLYYNQVLYSAPIYGGYNEMNRSIDELSEKGSAFVQSVGSGSGQYIQFIKTIYHNVFYFGFDKEQSMLMAKHYIPGMFPVLTYLFFIGLLILIVLNIRKFQKKYLAYFLCFILLSVVLIFYYGSWKFNDNPDPNSFTIGNSYTRYWLPIYLLMIPLASLAIVRISNALFLAGREIKTGWKRIAVVGVQSVVITLIIISGVSFVLYGSEEGITYVYYNNLAEKRNAEMVFQLTEPNSVIVTRYYDKFFFPERRIIMGTIPDEELLRAISRLVEYYPVYYYNFYLNSADVAYLNERKLNVHNLKITLVKKMNRNFGLYKLEASDNLMIDNLEESPK